MMNGAASRFFLLIQAGRNKSPDLIHDPRRSNEDGTKHRQLHPDDREAFHRSDHRQTRRHDVEISESLDGRLTHDFPQLVGEDQAEDRNATPSPYNIRRMRVRSSSRCSMNDMRSMPSSSSSPSDGGGGGGGGFLPPDEATATAVLAGTRSAPLDADGCCTSGVRPPPYPRS